MCLEGTFDDTRTGTITVRIYKDGYTRGRDQVLGKNIDVYELVEMDAGETRTYDSHGSTSLRVEKRRGNEAEFIVSKNGTDELSFLKQDVTEVLSSERYFSPV